MSSESIAAEDPTHSEDQNDVKQDEMDYIPENKEHLPSTGNGQDEPEESTNDTLSANEERKTLQSTSLDFASFIMPPVTEPDQISNIFEDVPQPPLRSSSSRHFKSSDPNLITDDHSSLSSSWASSSVTSAKTPSLQVVIEEDDQPFDRNMYYEMYDMIYKTFVEEKHKNNYLQRKMVEYYKKRKVLYALTIDTKSVGEITKKYDKLLDAFEDLGARVTQEQSRIQTEVANLRTKDRLLNDEVNTIFLKLQNIESEVARSLIENSDKISSCKIERYLKRQKSQLANLIKMRVHYIKIRNLLNEKQDQLKALDNLGSHLRLMDYEQLKLDNRNLCDKLEEKELELTRIRLKCQNAMQLLAHRREKAAAIATDLENLAEQNDTVQSEYEDVREQLNDLKQQRDGYRQGSNRLKAESGLLAKPKLRADMQDAIAEVKVLSQKSSELKENYVATSNLVIRLRRIMRSKHKTEEIKKQMAVVKGGGSRDFRLPSLMSTVSSASMEFEFPFNVVNGE